MVEVKVKIFTLEGCPKCPAAETLVEEVGEDYPITIEKVDLEKDMITGLQYGVVSTPSVAVGKEVISRGDVPKREELVEAIERTTG
jgi:glutaredoxin